MTADEIPIEIAKLGGWQLAMLLRLLFLEQAAKARHDIAFSAFGVRYRPREWMLPGLYSQRTASLMANRIRSLEQRGLIECYRANWKRSHLRLTAAGNDIAAAFAHSIFGENWAALNSDTIINTTLRPTRVGNHIAWDTPEEAAAYDAKKGNKPCES